MHGYHKSVFLKRLLIQQYIFRLQAGWTPLGDASDNVVCVLTSGSLFIFLLHFNLTAKRLNIPCLLPPGILSPRGFIIIIIIIIITIVFIIFSIFPPFLQFLLYITPLSVVIIVINAFVFK